MAERKSISKKLRFEVFKRDSFKCQYCGKSAPDVILECDHVVPVAEGGKTEMLNLITACRDCNRGKGKIRLSDNQAVDKQRKQLEEINERREQMEMVLQWKNELSKLKESQVVAVESLFTSITGKTLTDIGKTNIRKLINRFGFEEVFACTEISLDKYYNGTIKSCEFAVNKIGGVCYNRKHGRSWEGD